jgi:hypothetical protein
VDTLAEVGEDEVVGVFGGCVSHSWWVSPAATRFGAGVDVPRI